MKSTHAIAPELIQAHQDKINPLLERYLQNGSLHSTLLLTGIEGVGKKSLVRYFVQTLFCDEKTITPCEKCKSCVRAKANQWFDLYWLDPESSDEEARMGQHKVDAFRELKSKMGLGPIEEPFKVVVITEADRMTLQAANSILKILEEPPKNWLFILTASDSSRLLSTIRSRCMEIRLNPLTSEQIFAILKHSQGLELNSERGKIAARGALGSLSRAQVFLDESSWQLRDQFLGLLSSPAHEWLKLVEKMSESQYSLHRALDLLESIFSDLIQDSIHGNQYAWIHADQKEFLRQTAQTKKFTVSALTTAFEKVSERRKLVNLTLNSKLLAQEILIPVLEIL